MFCISTFYKFLDIEKPSELQSALKKYGTDFNIKGTIILATEGINATIAGSDGDISEFESLILSHIGEINFQHTHSKYNPFQKLKVKIKPEIVTLGLNNLDVSENGQYIDPSHWDDFISDARLKVVDTRNYYEVALGTFKNAINPNTNNFSDFIKWVEENLDKEDLTQPIAMFCTGGIRCEKSTAYMKKIGFKNVYHLKGGIIAYLKHKQNQSSLWNGSCFVFDERVMISSDLNPL